MALNQDLEAGRSRPLCLRPTVGCGERMADRRRAVHSTPGARTAWHTHPCAQTIWVIEGVGLSSGRSSFKVVTG
jgi:hypothetical protein